MDAQIQISMATCIDSENINCLIDLIADGADVNMRIGPNHHSPLNYAIDNGVNDELTMDIINILLDAGADIDFMSRNNVTALCLSMFMDSDRVARLLIDRGANINLPNIDGNTPLMITIKK